MAEIADYTFAGNEHACPCEKNEVSSALLHFRKLSHVHNTISDECVIDIFVGCVFSSLSDVFYLFNWTSLRLIVRWFYCVRCHPSYRI